MVWKFSPNSSATNFLFTRLSHFPQNQLPFPLLSWLLSLAVPKLQQPPIPPHPLVLYDNDLKGVAFRYLSPTIWQHPIIFERSTTLPSKTNKCVAIRRRRSFRRKAGERNEPRKRKEFRFYTNPQDDDHDDLMLEQYGSRVNS